MTAHQKAARTEPAPITRAEYEVLIARIEDLEDALRVRTDRLERHTRDYLPAELVNRLMGGEHPIRIWREHRGLTLQELSSRSGVANSYISEIEGHKKPGSAHALKKLAVVLDVAMDDLVTTRGSGKRK
ncbi:MAG TPA: helix-turn-helix transcriptional regulator [Alphaproteobacteria bacterium]|nr:helix-turn-helix transcriptional regulator [Alphaproteobacteria bacterium]